MGLGAAAFGSLLVNREMGHARAAGNAAPRRVAGIPMVDTMVAKAANELALSASPPYLYNHAVRTYLFGALIGRATKVKFDEELLYLACVLHDLGLTKRFMGNRPFEIEGAIAAGNFLRQQGLSSPKQQSFGMASPCILSPFPNTGSPRLRWSARVRVLT